MTDGATAEAPLPGLELARRYFGQAVEPIVAAAAPGLRYAAALIGDGSEVLGFDDAVSTDHEWGPRVLLFLSEEDFFRFAEVIVAALDDRLPPLFAGRQTAFPDRDRHVGLSLEARYAGSARHAVEVHSLGAWLERQIGIDVSVRAPSLQEWDAFDEQRLLSVTSGAVFRDDVGALAAVRASLAFLPEDVRLAKMARRWCAAAAELPFVGRAGHVGDDLGSRILCARLAEQAMRLCFLVDCRYAPYSKWLGTAWAAFPRPSAAAGISIAPWLRRNGSSGRKQSPPRSPRSGSVRSTLAFRARSRRLCRIIFRAPTWLSMRTKSPRAFGLRSALRRCSWKVARDWKARSPRIFRVGKLLQDPAYLGFARPAAGTARI
jgi:hypothetical protein